jgi:uncharacterized iron-regulated protein
MRGLITITLILLCCRSWSQSAWYDHYKIYDTQNKKAITLADLVQSVEKVNVLFFGEEHNDSIAHRLEDTLYLLLLDRYATVALSMEMFERDCQQVLDEYLHGFITGEMLAKEARSWSNYKDYRPMLNTARQRRQEVIAANAPRRYVNMISRRGLVSLDSLPKSARRYFAKLPIDTVNKPYFQKFSAAMGGSHLNSNTYYAQTMWDATMAETIYKRWKKNKSRKIFQLNGRFHSDERLGTITQLLRSSKKIKIRNISCFPAADFDKPDWKQYESLGDYIIVTDPEVPKSF